MIVMMVLNMIKGMAAHSNSDDSRRATQVLASEQPFEHAPVTVNGQAVSVHDSVHFQMLPTPKVSMMASR